jgi:hypothetical protein
MKNIKTKLALSTWIFHLAIWLVSASPSNSASIDTSKTDSTRLQKPNTYLKATPIAFWLNPGLGFSSNGYSAVTGLNASARNGLFVSLQGAVSGNLRIVNEAHEYASTASLLAGYRIPQSDFFATFGLGPVLGKGESSKRILIGKTCDIPGFEGCNEYDHQRSKHKGLGFIAQTQIGASNRYLGLSAQVHWLHFDGLSVIGLMVGLPMGLLY